MQFRIDENISTYCGGKLDTTVQEYKSANTVSIPDIGCLSLFKSVDVYVPPKVFYCIKRVYSTQCLTPLSLILLLLSIRIIKPQSPLGLQWMLLRKIGFLCRVKQYSISMK